MKHGAATAVRLVLVEDSPTLQVFMMELLKDLGFEVIGLASDVANGVSMVRTLGPDLVLSDVRLPDGDGIELSRRVLQERGVPIVLVTGYDARDPHLIFEAARAGALDVLPRPPGHLHPDHERLKQHLARTIRTLAGVRVVTRRAERGPQPAPPPPPARMPQAVGDPIIAVGASTGGPIVLAETLKALSGRRFAFGLVVQHLVPDFIDGFLAWLQGQINVPIALAARDATPERGVIYLAPPHSQVLMEPSGRFRITASSLMPTTHVPSIDIAFQSLAKFRPAQTVAILLTGMGRDGAEGLKALRDAKAFTIAQSPQTAAVGSMPESAIAMGAATATLSPSEIRQLLEGYLVAVDIETRA